MHKYVVAYLSIHDGEMLMEEVSARDEVEALTSVLELDPLVFINEEMIYQYCADTDTYVGVYQL
jgi:hydrogenase maturation factor